MFVDNGQTFKELQTRVAEECRCASYTGVIAGPPTDQHAADKVKRAINDAIGLIGLANPRWKCLKRRVDITLDVAGTGPKNLDGDPSRYALPAGVRGGFNAKWTWEAPGLGGWGGKAEDTTPERLRGLLANDQLKGYPQIVAVEPYRPVKGEAAVKGPVWMLMVYPRPDQAYIMTNAGRAVPTKLVDLDDRHVFGADFDLVVVAQAVACYERGGKAFADKQAYANALIVQAIALDKQQGADTVGQMNDGDSIAADDTLATRMAPIQLDGVTLT